MSTLKSLPKLVCFALLFWNAKGQGTSEKFPLVKEVVEKFYTSYTVDYSSDGYITFEKRKEGWFVVQNRFEDNSLIPYEKLLFYDFSRNQYNDLHFYPNDVKREIKVSDYLDNYSIRNFDLQLYYGYRGWYKDVINELKARKELTDDEMYGLARAYSAYSFNLFSDQGQEALIDEIWTLSLSINCFSGKQIDAFTQLSLIAQDWFKTLYKRNPGYKTPVGDIGIKYANEVVTWFHILLTHAEKYAASIQLPQNLYPDSLLQPLREILKDCPANSILLSYGDNDFYPVLYLQKNERLRRDVYLINYNLLNLERYIFRATAAQFEAAGIKLSVDSNFYKGQINDLVFINDSLAKIKFNYFKLLLKNNPGDEYNRPDIKASSIELNRIGKEKKDNPIINIEFNDEKYLFKNQWILFDIIENSGDRKICFPAPFEESIMADLNKYLTKRKSIWILE